MSIKNRTHNRFVITHKKLLLAALIAVLCGRSLLASFEPEITCHVDGTDDLFKVYPRQKIFSSNQFSIYQLIDGLTVLIINRQTLQFNRLSSLNLLPHSTLDPELPAESMQFFSGRCEFSFSK
jgi:hypothetical protein